MRISEVTDPTPYVVEQAMVHCQAAAQSRLSLYRGIEIRPFKEQFVKDIRQDRMLKDSSKNEGRLFDVYCEILGFPHRKANSLSTSKNVNQAAEYGITVFEILPFDGSVYLYSPTISDFLDIAAALNKFWHQKVKEGTQEDIIDPTDDDFRALFMPNKNRLLELAPLNITQSLDEASASAKGEVLVYGTKYVGKFYDHLQ